MHAQETTLGYGLALTPLTDQTTVYDQINTNLKGDFKGIR